jgi:uncharacterized protein with PIN domain
MPHPLDCVICGSRWFSARFQGRVDIKSERCPDCGGPLVRADAEPVVRAEPRVLPKLGSSKRLSA